MSSTIFRWVAALAIVVITVCNSSGQHSPISVKTVLDSIYNQNFSAAAKLTSAIVDDPIATSMLEAQRMRWQYVPVAFGPHADKYIQHIYTTESKWGAIPSSGRYYKICNYFLQAEFHFCRGDQFKAANALQKAYSLITDSFEDKNAREEDDFIQGLYLSYADIYDDLNFSGTLIFSMLKKGDLSKGLELLKKSAFSNSVAGTEAAIYYAHIQFRYEKNYASAVEVYEKLAKLYPANLKFQELHAWCLLKLQEYELAIPIVAQLKNANEPFYVCATTLFEGVIAEEYDRNTIEAQVLYKAAIEDAKQYGPMLNHYTEEADKRLERLGAQNDQ